MGKKKKVDPGLQYLQKIGFSPIRGKKGLADRFIRLWGRQRTEEIFRERSNYKDGSTEFYEYKNSSYEISTAFSETYDGDIIRKACNYIAENVQFFGKTILEIGCESGYLTGFLALTFPDATIYAIDRSESAIKIAKKRIEQLGVENVVFQVIDEMDFSETFDTVFAMRVLQENYEYEDDNDTFNGNPLDYLLYLYSEKIDPHTQKLSTLLKPTGFLVSFERCGYNPLLFAYVSALNKNGCGLLMETYKEHSCTEVENTSTFQGFVFSKKMSHETQEIFDWWSTKLVRMHYQTNHIESWEASVYLMVNAGELIKGYYVFSPSGVKIGKVSAYLDIDDPSQIIYYKVIGRSEQHAFAFPDCERENILKDMGDFITVNEKDGCIIKEFIIEDDREKIS